MIFIVKLKKYMDSNFIFSIIRYKFYYEQKLGPVVLLPNNKYLEVGFYSIILFLGLAIYL